jgi:hypothetical protein
VAQAHSVVHPVHQDLQVVDSVVADLVVAPLEQLQRSPATP